GNAGLDLGDEARPVEPQRLELGVDRALERARGAPARRRQSLRARAIALLGRARGRLEPGERLGPGVERGKVGGVARRERRELVDCDIVLAACRTQREQPLLDALELARVKARCIERLLEMRA